jgi:hypothetical protein
MSRQAIYNDKAQKATFAGRVERPNPLIGALYLHARIACLDYSNVVFRFEHAPVCGWGGGLLSAAGIDACLRSGTILPKQKECVLRPHLSFTL